MDNTTFKDVQDAAELLKGVAHRTPVMTSRTLNQELGAEVFIKCENFQKTGAFKFRGAYNALYNLSDEDKKKGVHAFSSGNHAQALAYAGKLLGIKTTLFMPKESQEFKKNATREQGGTVLEYPRDWTRQQISEEFKAILDSTILIDSASHKYVTAGQATVTKELIEDAGQLDHLFVVTGGGGLLAGACLSVKELSPSCKIHAVEPEVGNDGQQSFEKGEIVVQPLPADASIADGALSTKLGDLTFEIIKENVTDFLTVTDEQIRECMRFYAERMKIVVEPTGCIGLAAARYSGIDLKGQKVGVLISGGNVDLGRFGKLISNQPNVK